MTPHKFIFDNDIPPEIKPELEKFLFPLHWLIPSWCEKVYIHWSDVSGDKAGAAISANAEYEYRYAGLTFYPCWHAQPDSEKREQVIHDMLHAFTTPLADYAQQTIELLLPKEDNAKFQEHALRELTVRHESFVQDLALCIDKHLMGPENTPAS